MIAVAHEELDQRGLVAFRQAVSPQPSLLEVCRLHFQRLSNEPAGRKPHPRVRRPRGRMRTPVHPDRPMALERLVVPMDRHEALRVRVAFFPCSGVADRSNRVRRDVAVALVMAQGDARGVVREREESSGLVDRKSAVVAELGPGAPLHCVLVERRCPVSGDVESGRRHVGSTGRGRLRQERRARRRDEEDCDYLAHGVGFHPVTSFCFL